MFMYSQCLCIPNIYVLLIPMHNECLNIANAYLL